MSCDILALLICRVNVHEFVLSHWAKDTRTSNKTNVAIFHAHSIANIREMYL